MKKRIFSYCMVIVIIACVVIGSISLVFTNGFYSEMVENNAKSQIALIENFIQSYDVATDYESIAATLKKGNRITFFDMDGNVLGDSAKMAGTMENHMNRVEVNSAVRTGYGKSVRESSTTKIKTMYFAQKLAHEQVVLRVGVPIDSLKIYENQLSTSIFIAILIGLGVALVFANRFSKWFLLPIIELTSGVRKVANGKYEKLHMIDRDDEIGVLAKSFDNMSRSMKQGIYELKYQNASTQSIVDSVPNCIIAVNTKKEIILVNDEAAKLLRCEGNKKMVMNRRLDQILREDCITALVEKSLSHKGSYGSVMNLETATGTIYSVTVTPITSKDLDYECKGCIVVMVDITNMKKLENMRSEFVSNVTHELRTPLTSIRGFVETLKDGAIEEKEIAYGFLDIIEVEALRLSKLIDDILDLSEIEHPKSGEEETVNLKEVAEQVIHLLKKEAKEKQVQLILEMDENLTLQAGTHRMKQMLINLIENGIKYNKEGGYVKIKAERTGSSVKILVEDSGIGIDRDNQTRIFERFYRVDKGRSRSMGGTGLGLSLVKHIAYLYGGTVTVTSEIDKGSVFMITFPQ